MTDLGLLDAGTLAGVGLTTDDVRALVKTPAEAYLVDHGGVDPSELDALRDNLTERRPTTSRRKHACC